MDLFFKNQDNKDDLLQQQMATQQKINELLSTSASTLACGPDCQKQKISEELKEKYLDAQANIQTAPANLESAKKNYYIYTEGKTYYNSMEEDELKKKAETLANELKNKFNEEKENALTMNSYLQTALINSSHTEDLFSEYKHQNYLLTKEISDSHGQILTNDRKTFYEEHAIQDLKFWRKFLGYLYLFLSIVMVCSLVLVKNSLNWISRIMLGVLVFTFPYYMNFVFDKMYMLMNGTMLIIIIAVIAVLMNKSINWSVKIVILMMFYFLFSFFGFQLPEMTSKNVYADI
jgi:hypothetical protein